MEALAVAPITKRPPAELVCPCGVTFEPLPWFDAERDEPVCDACAGEMKQAA